MAFKGTYELPLDLTWFFDQRGDNDSRQLRAAVTPKQGPFFQVNARGGGGVPESSSLAVFHLAFLVRERRICTGQGVKARVWNLAQGVCITPPCPWANYWTSLSLAPNLSKEANNHLPCRIIKQIKSNNIVDVGQKNLLGCLAFSWPVRNFSLPCAGWGGGPEKVELKRVYF